MSIMVAICSEHKGGYLNNGGCCGGKRKGRIIKWRIDGKIFFHRWCSKTMNW